MKIQKIPLKHLLLFALILLNFSVWAQDLSESSDDLYQMVRVEMQKSKDYNKAIELCKRGLQISPDYHDIRVLLGRLYYLTDSTEKAKDAYGYVINKISTYPDAFTGLAAVYEKERKYEEAIQLYDQLLLKHADDSTYLFKKAALLQAARKYKEAALVSKSLKEKYPENKKYAQLYSYQNSLINLPNQIGLLHMQSHFDNSTRASYVTSFQYLRQLDTNRNVIIGRINYANRQFGQGVQAEAESYLVHNKKYYSFIQGAWSGQAVFPKLKFGYSLFRNFEKGWEMELGTRYLKAGENDVYSSTGAIGKYVGNAWLNFKTFVTKDDSKWQQAYVFTGRQYLNDKKDFLSLILSAGTSPDDRSRNFDVKSFGGLVSKSAAIGYQKTIKSSTIISVFGAWNNLRMANNKYLNQTDFYINLFRNF